MSDRANPPTSSRRPRGAGPDATSVAAFVTLCTYTWFLYGIGPSLPLFRDELGTTSAVAGLHSLMLAAGIVIAGFLGVGLARRWRRYGVARRGVVVMAVGGVAVHRLVRCSPAPNWPSRCRPCCSIGFGGGLALNVSTTVLQEHNGAYGPAMLSLGNAAAAGVGLVTPLAVGAATALGWTWRAAWCWSYRSP